MKNLIIPGNWASIAVPIEKEFSVEMCVSGSVVEPTVKIFGKSIGIVKAMRALGK